MNPKSNFFKAAKKAVATFVFSTGGVLIGVNVLDADLKLWKLAASTGIGSLINLLYRWSESTIKDPNGDL